MILFFKKHINIIITTNMLLNQRMVAMLIKRHKGTKGLYQPTQRYAF